jgi:biopolymer transport protein ExbD
MAFANFDNKNSHSPIMEINMVPLIDVMLVLLVIFIITTPLMTHAIKVDLPDTAAITQNKPAEKIELSITKEGIFYIGNEIVDRNALIEKLNHSAQLTEPPELHIRADENTPYKLIAQAMGDASHAGLTKIGFVSTPQSQPARP